MKFRVECPQKKCVLPSIAQIWFNMSGEMSSFIWWISRCFRCFSLEDPFLQNSLFLPGSCLKITRLRPNFSRNGLVSPWPSLTSASRIPDKTSTDCWSWNCWICRTLKPCFKISCTGSICNLAGWKITTFIETIHLSFWVFEHGYQSLPRCAN